MTNRFIEIDSDCQVTHNKHALRSREYDGSSSKLRDLDRLYGAWTSWLVSTFIILVSTLFSLLCEAVVSQSSGMYRPYLAQLEPISWIVSLLLLA